MTDATPSSVPTEPDPREPFHVPADSTVGVLVLHGLSGAVYSVREWARSLTPHCAVRVPALPGHRGTWEELSGTTWQDWYDHAEEELVALQEEHERVVVAGLSMGGALALRLAQEGSGTSVRSHDPRAVDGLVLVNPALSLHNRSARAARAVKHLVRSTAGIGSDIAKPGEDERAYPRMPVSAVAQLNELMTVTSKNLGRVTAPVLVLRSRQDHVVSHASHERIMRRCSGPVEAVMLPRSYHVATLDHEAQLIRTRTKAFVDAVAAGRCPVTGAPLDQVPVPGATTDPGALP